MASLTPLQGSLGTRRAAHLLRRTSFRYNKNRVDALAQMTATNAVSALLQPQALFMDQPVYSDGSTTWLLPTGLTAPDQDFVLRRYVLAWWTNEALRDNSMLHKMTLFFHQHLATNITSFGNAQYFDYLNLLRWGALGNFKKLAEKIIYDNCMLRYLNNQQNTVNNPNENFAREFFELFTIGKGPQLGPGDYTNYTEDDIVQAARVFTGIRTQANRSIIDPETNIPKGVIQAGLHDSGAKIFSAKFQGATIQGGNTPAAITLEIQNFVNMVFAQEEVSRNFCRRLYHWFVARNISAEIETDIIEPLAATFRNNNYEVAPVIAQLLESLHFYDEDDSDNSDEIVGGLIKSPIELVYQAIHLFGLDAQIPSPYTNPNAHYRQFYDQTIISHMFALTGFNIFFPSDVAGYPGFYQMPDLNRQWFNSSTIIGRYKLPAMLLAGKRLIGAAPQATTVIKLNIAQWVQNSGFFTDPSDPLLLVQEFLRYTLPETPDSDRLTYFYETVFLDNLPPYDWTAEWQNYLATNNDSEVKIALERLVNAVMYSPEYQTF